MTIPDCVPYFLKLNVYPIKNNTRKSWNCFYKNKIQVRAKSAGIIYIRIVLCGENL